MEAVSSISCGKVKEIEFGTNAMLLSILIGLFFVAGFVSPGFLKLENLFNLTRIVSLTGVMAIGLTYVMLVGEIDLSVGAIMSLSAVMGGRYLHLGIGPVLAITCGIGLLLGFVNGVGVVKGRVPSLIMTLATLSVFSGLANIVSGGKAVYPYQLPAYLWLGNGNLLGVPFPVVVFIIVALVSIFVLNYTEFGRWVYYTGANRTASRLSGGRTNRQIILTFLISGLFASMVGPMISGQINRIWPTQGAGYELAAIAITVLGGTSLTGGKGTVTGTFIAALIFGGLMNILNLSGVGTYLQDVVKGALLVFVVGMMYLREKRLRAV
ncbi:MAG: ribose ABC transporter permease [candidate division Zixibacteria bacterium]|nr:ribose ABC transporter permease [candidate division Zixibacteria bacterium]